MPDLKDELEDSQSYSSGLTQIEVIKVRLNIFEINKAIYLFRSLAKRIFRLNNILDGMAA